MSHSLLAAIAVVLFAAAAGLVWRLRRRAARRAPRMPDTGYDLSLLGQESYQPAQHFEGLQPTAAYRPGFDAQRFLAEQRASYVALQQARDARDLGRLLVPLRPEVRAQLQAEIDAHEVAPAPTEFVTLQALLLDVGARGDEECASIEFSGLRRETGWGGAHPVREIWNLVRRPDAAWTVAAIQSLA